MFELSLAKKYLLPRWRQLSVSLISVISIVVISLVVWLIVVFFSVTHGLEHIWINKLIALTAPARITPKEAYYQSYYYQIDRLSSSSDYTVKNLDEKRWAENTDPYDPFVDEELSSTFPKPDTYPDGSVKDLAKELYASLEKIQGIADFSYEEYDTAYSQLDLKMVRRSKESPSLSFPFFEIHAVQAEPVFLGSHSPSNETLDHALLPIDHEDIHNVFHLLGAQAIDPESIKGNGLIPLTPDLFQKKLLQFLTSIKITSLKTPEQGWRIPEHFLPEGDFSAVGLFSSDDKHLLSIFIHPINQDMSTFSSYSIREGMIQQEDGKQTFLTKEGEAFPINTSISLFLSGGLSFSAQFLTKKMEMAQQPKDLLFSMEFSLQGHSFVREMPLDLLEIDAYESIHPPSLLWIHKDPSTGLYSLPDDPEFGEGILLPRGFREKGSRIGDRGSLTYYTPTATGIQEQQIPIFVAGFYDPGIIPLGGKYVLTHKETASLIRNAHNPEDTQLSSGLNLRFSRLDQADRLKEQLQQQLDQRGIAPYFEVTTYAEYPFTKDLIQQLHSERNLYTLLATVIIIVACSNIISMLIILVNDKKHEIGILRSMGATSFSIALIFGFCGVVMGALGSLIGTAAALFTLANLDSLIRIIGYIQGYEMFHTAFYGDTIPNELSPEALLFVFGATLLISLIAGLIPAIKACRLRPSAILRAE